MNGSGSASVLTDVEVEKKEEQRGDEEDVGRMFWVKFSASEEVLLLSVVDVVVIAFNCASASVYLQ